MLRRLLQLAAAVLALAPVAAHADDERPPARLTVAPAAGIAYFHRSSSEPSSRGGLLLGGELRLHPTPSPHGISATGYTGGGIFGPNVSVFDVAYSYRLFGGAPLRDATGAAYVDVGPMLAFVSNVSPAADHAVLGARASVCFDAYLGFFLVGIDLGYRGGVPMSGTKDAFEGAASALLRAGFAFDLRPHHRSRVAARP